MVFTSSSYILVTSYLALVEFKTWSGPSWARPGYSCSVVQGTDRSSNISNMSFSVEV